MLAVLSDMAGAECAMGGRTSQTAPGAEEAARMKDGSLPRTLPLQVCSHCCAHNARAL